MRLKPISLCAAAALFCSLLLCGCAGQQYDTVLTLDGEPVCPALYRVYQIQSYVQAAQTAGAPGGQIEGKEFSDWVQENTLQLLRARHYYEEQFEAQGLAFTPEEEQQLKEQAASAWQSLGRVYEKNGVDEAAYLAYLTTNAKAVKLFDLYCAQVSDQEIRSYLEENFLLIEYIQLPRISADGSAMEAGTLAQVDQLAAGVAGQFEAAPDPDFAALGARAVSQAYALGGFTPPDLSDQGSYLHSSYLRRGKTGDSFTDGLAAAADATPPGRCGVFSDSQLAVVYHRLPNYRTEADFQALRSSVLVEMHSGDFSAEGAAVWENYPLQADPKALEYYSPKKLDLSS